MEEITWRLVFFGVFLALGVSCGDGQPFELAPKSTLPDFVRDAPPQVQEAYRFAIANPDVLQNFPCYCGCVSAGHTSNLDCYVQEIQPDGTLVFDNHAFG